MLLRRKGTVSHRRLGWIWVILMATAALSSLFIRTIHPRQFSPIHILSVVTLVALPWGIYATRTGRLRRHRWTLIGLFTGGLVLARLFPLLPHLPLGHLLFGCGLAFF